MAKVSYIENLPLEMIYMIADMCSWGVEPRGGGLSSCARYLAHFVRTSRTFHYILNNSLYKWDIALGANSSCLLWAAWTGNLRTLQLAHKAGADLRCAPRKKTGTPLHTALIHNHVQIVDYLLANGADPHAASTRLCWCAVGMKRALYPLHFALSHSDPKKRKDFVEKLLSYGAYKIAADISVLSQFTKTYIPAYPLLQPLLERDDDLSLHSRLLFAASREDVALVRRCLAHPGTDAASSDWRRRTPLHWVVDSEKCNLDILKLLLERHEVDPLAEDDMESTPILNAIERGHTEAVHILLQRPEVDVNASNSSGVNSLHWAAYKGRSSVIALILQKGAIDVNAVDAVGMNALHYAAQSDEGLHVLQRLICAGVSLDKVCRRGCTPFSLAVYQRRFRLALALLLAGSDPFLWGEHLPVRYCFILHSCLSRQCHGQKELVEELISRGAPIDSMGCVLDSIPTRTRDGTEATPLYYAATHATSIECMMLLLEAGARTDCSVVYSRVQRGFSGLLYETVKKKSILAAIFESWWGTPPGSLLSEALVQEKADEIRLLLRYRASLDVDSYHVGPLQPSALEFACIHATHGQSALLEFLVAHAMGMNVSLSHVQALRRCYRASAPHDTMDTAFRLGRLEERLTNERLAEEASVWTR